MDWVRLDAGFTTHPKLAKVGPVGGWVYVEGMCYAGQHRTNGFIPAAAIPRLLSCLVGVAVVEDSRRSGKLRRTKPAELIDWPGRLVAAGLWEVVEGGYQIHNYLHRNPTREFLEHLEETRRDAGRKGGLAKALASATAKAWQNPSKPLARNVTVRNEEKPLFFSGSNDDQSQAESSPEPASSGENLTPEQVRGDVQKLVRDVLRPKA
jgi:hypothetical protein